MKDLTRQDKDKRRLMQIPVRLLRNGVQGSNKRNGSISLLHSDRRSSRESNGDDEERWVTRQKIQNTEIEGQMDNYLPTENFQIWDCKGNEPH
jgi:hypothetical protein